MQKKSQFVFLAVVAVAAGFSMAAPGGRRSRTPEPVSILTPVEIEDLQFMREEEKLARDVYTAFYAEWGNNIFTNIARSEQSHTDAILNLLNRYQLEDPVLDVGLFSDPELQVLFDSLVGQGRQSALDALRVGALIEEVDMKDIAEAMERTDDELILRTYSRLMAGSENHLRAFVRNIERLTGEAYVAQWIFQEEVDAILGR